MEIKVAPAGWEKVKPLEGLDVTIEVRRMNLEEKMDLIEEVVDGEAEFKFTGKAGREVFKKFCRNIEGLEFAGEKITKPSKLFTQDFPADAGVIHLIGASVGKFWEINFPTEDLEKKPDAPSDFHGGEVANLPADG